MRDNEFVRVKGAKIILVPYEAHHVPKYHDWMASEELQKLTASERLTLEEEYDMQQKWREDPDKCTFIILDREKYERDSNQDAIEKEIGAMVGDVNIFYMSDCKSRLEGELEIMIAEPSARGKGLGKEALCSMIRYAKENIGTESFVGKIGFSNKASLNLFTSLGFKEVSKSDVFEEVTMLLEKSSIDLVLQFTKYYTLDSVIKT